MMESKSRAKARKIYPTSSVLFVSSTELLELLPQDLSHANIGYKALGLAALPLHWILPFVSVSADLFQAYQAQPEHREAVLADWSSRIRAAILSKSISSECEIIVRSSGCSEEMSKRGKFYSAVGNMVDLQDVIRECLQQLCKDKDISEEQIPLIVQQYCSPTILKGHLSNERRCYKEFRDWLGEFESTAPEKSAQFTINIRNWRKTSEVSSVDQLNCVLSPLISETLRIPAQWATYKCARVHFEWVWNGRSIYIVQADEEFNTGGHNPVKEHRNRKYRSVAFSPLCLRAVDQSDGERFSKIANTRTYARLGLPTAPLYILDGKETIKQISNRIISPGLKHDISKLVKGSLIIRTDLATNNLEAKQLLPRTEEMRKTEQAFEWLVEQSERLSTLPYDSAFILHNFIPSLAAAFAYATPTDPVVQIESLWGLPEGLYYNTHDKYVVDTGKPDINSVSEQDEHHFKVREKRGYKRVFVSTTESGKWETLQLAPPYDWQGSLSQQDCKYIARQSRRIATEENRAVSIMWFVGVPKNIATVPAIPWYHEQFDLSSGKPSLATKTKTLFDKSFIIQSSKDIDILNGITSINSRVTRIKIQPTDEKLLRDKNTLKKIGEIAKGKGAILVLEGAVLSHAYYQLLATGANVEVINPFIGFGERHSYNKLVRDRIPEIIRERGEIIKTSILDAERLVKALREKLIEEAYETNDAKDLNSIKSELVDMREIIDSVVRHLNISEDELRKQQDQKNADRGTFDKGIILVETQNQLPTNKLADQNQPLLTGFPVQNSSPTTIDDPTSSRRTDSIAKWTDRRVLVNQTETKVRIVIPVTKKNWSCKTNKEAIGISNSTTVHGEAKGERSGNQWNVEVSVFIVSKPPDLL